MTETAITTGKHYHEAGTSIGIWGWEIPVYLFLGGLAAGVMIIASLTIILRRERDLPVAAKRLILWPPVLITLGMIALFIDLSHKLYVWNFYIAFKPASPMSWGAWILVLVYPVTIIIFLATVKDGYPAQYEKIIGLLRNSKFARIGDFLNIAIGFSVKNVRKAAIAALPAGILLGIYTGVLLSSLGARPFWNSALLGPLFLVSGLSGGAALAMLLSGSHEREFFSRLDLGLIAAEIALLALFLIGLAASTEWHISAVSLVFGGSLTPVFWGLVVFTGLALPIFLELAEKTGIHAPAHLVPALVLAGGLFLRIVIVYAGQVSAWASY